MGQGKGAICANKQYALIDEQAVHFLHYLDYLSNAQVMQTAGLQSPHYWLTKTLLKKFSAPA